MCNKFMGVLFRNYIIFISKSSMASTLKLHWSALTRWIHSPDAEYSVSQRIPGLITCESISMRYVASTRVFVTKECQYTYNTVHISNINKRMHAKEAMQQIHLYLISINSWIYLYCFFLNFMQNKHRYYLLY